MVAPPEIPRNAEGGRSAESRAQRRLPYPHIYAELPKISIPRTWVNKPVHTFATHSSGLVATKIIHLGDAPGDAGCYLFQGSGKKV